MFPEVVIQLRPDHFRFRSAENFQQTFWRVKVENGFRQLFVILQTSSNNLRLIIVTQNQFLSYK